MTARADGRSLPLPSLRVTIAEAAQSQRSIETIAPWFAIARAEIRGRALQLDGVAGIDVQNWAGEPSSALQRRLIELNGLPIGLASYEQAGERLLIHELAVAPQQRDRGFGAEAVFTIEALSGAAESLAFVPLANGLAVYFWLRIGYRPLFRSGEEWLGYTVMVRDLRDAGVPRVASNAAR